MLDRFSFRISSTYSPNHSITCRSVGETSTRSRERARAVSPALMSLPKSEK